MNHKNSSENRKVFWNEILPQVERPSRYLGTEWNAIHKNIENIQLRIALVFPDLYELGLGNLGLHILYALLNQKSHIWAERVYAPAPDLERLLRQKNIPLFLWESKDSVNIVDLIGFTLQSELTFTTVLNILNLSHIPILSKERTEKDPLICAGGPCCFNPEPMAPFIDFFVIGDGEEIILHIADILLQSKSATRLEKLERLSQLNGVYVPSFYQCSETPNGSVIPNLSKKIHRAVTSQLTDENYITKYIVPYTSLIHEGLSIEVMRGCTHGCRFCLAGCISRPVRERSSEQVQTIVSSLLPTTGLETVSLVSLSTCDHSQIEQLLNDTLILTNPTITSVALPSLRLDSFSVLLADAVSPIRRSGLTFAPEAGSERLRNVINKSVTDEDLMEIIRIAFKKGWTHVKLYFMIGLPTETDGDIEALINLTVRCLHEARKIRSSAHIHLGISTFVPKPWTPFQWAPQISLNDIKEKQKRILKELKKYKAIKINFHVPESSFIEGLISRGDRRTSNVILSAWRLGAKLETSSDNVNIEYWYKALEEHNLTAEEFLRHREETETFPWDFIDPGIEKKWLYKEWLNAQRGNLTYDCRGTQCNLCGIQKWKELRCIHWQNKERTDTTKTEKTNLLPTNVDYLNKKPVQRILLNVSKIGSARFLSHLEFQNTWIRILRRAQLPVLYSSGYHAHARISLALPAPVGETVIKEYLETWLYTELPIPEIKERITQQLPKGILVHDIQTIPLTLSSVMERAKAIHYALLIQSSEPIEDALYHKLITYIQSSLLQLLNEEVNKLHLPNFIVPFHYDPEMKIYLIQWLTPIIKGKFIKPSQIKTYVKETNPNISIQTFRINTYLDTLPNKIIPITISEIRQFINNY
ncbi:MAG TPA: TIGR03960 family B12-binding radical SAM protein [Candidatus Hydrogenedens sp.]|nr:TIGR03960 family B12-binding radical SAM protein [Candidatus Hydrogenedens sp.]